MTARRTRSAKEARLRILSKESIVDVNGTGETSAEVAFSPLVGVAARTEGQSGASTGGLHALGPAGPLIFDQLVEGDGEHDHSPGDEGAPGRLDAEEDQAAADDLDDQHADDGADDGAGPAG